jgi:ligand-binding sensor domain-containing protein
MLLIALGSGAALVVLALLVVGGIVLATYFNARRGTPGVTQIAGLNGTPAIAPTATAPESTVVPVASLENATYTSWTSANMIYSVQVADDLVITSGPGGVTVWNRGDGSIAVRASMADGLPTADIRTLFVDDAESAWIGTAHGLVFSDGQELIHYTVEDGLDSNYITEINRLGDGRLIVGTYYSEAEGDGLNVFDGRSWEAWPDFPSAHPDSSQDRLSSFVNAVIEDDDGALWVGTNRGLGRFDGETWTRFTTDDGLPSDNIYSLLASSEGQLIAGTERGAAILEGQRFQRVEQIPETGVNGIVEDADGRIWFSGGGGLWTFNPERADWREFTQDSRDLPTWGIYGSAADDDGNVYFGSDGEGLVVYSAEQQEFSIWKVPNVPFSASYGAILPAPDGRLLFTEQYSSDTDIFDPQSETWALPENLTGRPILFDGQGRLWTVDYQDRFWIIQDGDLTEYDADQGVPAEYSLRDIVFARDGTAWFSSDRGLLAFDGNSVTRVLSGADIGLRSDFVRTLFAASDGSLWVAGDVNLSHVTGDTHKAYGPGDPFEYDVPVFDIEEDRSGAIWVGTEGLGLYRFADGEWTHFMPTDPGVDMPSPYVTTINVAPDGTLWFGTYQGAVRYDGAEWFIVETGSAGLIAPAVWDLYVAPNGTAFFATDGGVTQMKP